MKLLLIVSLLVELSAQAYGASIEHDKKNGVITTRIAGQVIQSGYVDSDGYPGRSGVTVFNPFPELTMSVRIQLFELTHNAGRYWSGRDPLLGQAPKRIMRQSAVYKDLGESLFVASPGILLDNGGVILMVRWFDASGKEAKKPALVVFNPGSYSDRAWRYSYLPFEGQDYDPCSQ